MKTYEVDLVSRVTANVQANSSREAIEKAKESYTQYDVDAVCCGDEQIVVYQCEGCGEDILDTDDYAVSDEDGYYVCSKCAKEA